MSSSMQDERSIALFIISSIVLILLSTIETASAINLVDLPLKIPGGSANLHATLTDAKASNKYFIQEVISASGSGVKGKISISGEKETYSVYYNDTSDFNKQRLVIHGTNCLPFNFKNNWDKTLPGISKPVTNLVLLMGPSILYRLDHSSLVWKEAQDKNIRGTMMKGATTEINKRLKVTYYYRKHFDEFGIKNPSRIEFSGYDPYSTSYSSRENLILDIYLQKENHDDILANEVQPLPGIGCPHYLTDATKQLPRLITNYVHYTMYEYIQGATNTQTFSEIHASGVLNLLRLKATLLGKTTEAFYDYQLGVFYLFQDEESCNVSPADLNAPGIKSYGRFTLDSLLLIEQYPSSFLYLGKLNLEHRSGFPVDVWESTRFNVNINGKKVDKAVITQYFAKSRDSKIFDGYTLVSTTIAIYKLDPSKKTYTLTDGITRDFMNFEDFGLEDELHDIFSIKKCKYLTSDKTLTLGFKFKCEDDASHCTELTKRRVYEFKKDFFQNFLTTLEISSVRISDIEYNLNDGQIEIDVTFLETPNFQNLFNSKTLSVSEDTFKNIHMTIKANTEYECLNAMSKILDNIIVVIYRPSDSLCGFLQSYNYLKEDTKAGQPCSVYHFPLDNLHRISREIPLDKIQNAFMQIIGRTYSLFDERDFKHYKFIDLIDKTKTEASAEALQFQIEISEKLKSVDRVTVVLPDVKTFADCYKNCHDSEELECITFSFCQHGDSVECRVSSLTQEEVRQGDNEEDTSCSIYALNILNEYSKVNNRKFKTPTTIAMEKYLDSCAEACHASPDCYSFQYCDYSCSFGGFYTDAATQYDERCEIFYPKVSQYYQRTGNKIVSEVIYTEMNGNLDQCASLCHGWSDGETGCKSFNYCPKSRTESSCSLTKLSVKSSDTKTVEGGDCSNYELKVESNGKKNKESSSTEVTKSTSGSGAFGIIMAFLFVGALLGFVAPIGYTKFKQLRNASETSEAFTWTRQLNEQDENIN